MPLVRCATPVTLEDHARVAERIAALAGCTARVAARGSSVAVTFALGRKKRTIVQADFDVERTLHALESLLPGDHPRRFYQVERDNLDEDLAITFASGREILHLIEHGWIVVSHVPHPPEVHIVEGLRVRGPILRWDDGSLKRVELAEDAYVYGLRCAAATPVRFANGRVCDVTLAAPVALPDCTLPPGTRAFFHYRSQVIGLAKLGARIEVSGLALPPGTELELDERARLTAAVLGADAPAPSGYRERAVLPAETTLTYADGKWRVEDPDRRPLRRPRRWRTVERAPAVWSWLALLIGAPAALLCALSWLRSKDVGERCRDDVECHHLLGDRCEDRVCQRAHAVARSLSR